MFSPRFFLALILTAGIFPSTGRACVRMEVVPYNWSGVRCFPAFPLATAFLLPLVGLPPSLELFHI